MDSAFHPRLPSGADIFVSWVWAPGVTAICWRGVSSSDPQCLSSARLLLMYAEIDSPLRLFFFLKNAPTCKKTDTDSCLLCHRKWLFLCLRSYLFLRALRLLKLTLTNNLCFLTFFLLIMSQQLLDNFNIITGRFIFESAFWIACLANQWRTLGTFSDLISPDIIAWSPDMKKCACVCDGVSRAWSGVCACMRLNVSKQKWWQ